MKIEARPKPDPGPEFWSGYWDRLRARMEREAPAPGPGPAARAERMRPSPTPFRRMLWPAAAAALLAAGVLVGRLAFRPALPPGFKTDRYAGSDLAVRTGRYLDRSRSILLALVNSDPASQDAYGLDRPEQKRASRVLVYAASALMSDLGRAKERRLEKLVGDLQIILRQIANLDAQSDSAAVDIVRAGVEGRDILFQINLARMRGETPGGPSADKRTKKERSS